MRFLLNSMLIGFLVMFVSGTALAEQDGDSAEASSTEEPDDSSLPGEGEEEDFIDESEFIDVFDMHEDAEPSEAAPQEKEEDVAAGPTKTPPLRIGGAVAIGIGGAALIAGAVTGALALKSNNNVKDNCDNSGGGGYLCDTTESQDELEKRDKLALSTDILLGAGAGIAIAGVLMVVFSYDWKKSKEENETGEGLEKSISLRPILGPGMVGTTVEWRF
jgi:hypothetical protein